MSADDTDGRKEDLERPDGLARRPTPSLTENADAEEELHTAPESDTPQPEFDTRVNVSIASGGTPGTVVVVVAGTVVVVVVVAGTVVVVAGTVVVVVGTVVVVAGTVVAVVVVVVVGSVVVVVVVVVVVGWSCSSSWG